MANNRTTVVIDADVSGVQAGTAKAAQALDGLGGSIKRQDKDLNKYGERLGKAFGPGQGLHGRLDSLEMPLRDVEGSFDRVSMATRVWGNTSETASEKATVGFLLAADAIATFTSGGVAGIAIAAAVAGFAMLAKAMQDEATAAEEAKKAQDEHMKALQAVGKSAVDAGMSIAALNAQEAASAAMGGLRAAEENLRLGRLKLRQLKDEVLDRRALRREVVTQGAQATRAFDMQSAALARQLQAQEKGMTGLERAVGFARTKAKESVSFYLDDLRSSQESAVTSAIEGFKRLMDQGSKAIKDTGEKAVRTAEESTQKISELDRKVMADNAAFDRAEREADAAYELDQQKQQQQKRFQLWAMDARVLAQAKEAQRKQENAREKAAAEERKAIAQGATMAITNGLFAMAKAGEFSAEKLLEATLVSTGQQLVSRGTLHLFEGLATLPAGANMAAQGGAMVAAGLAMGAAGGAIGRAGAASSAPTENARASTPTDTRQTRAASSAADGGGGTTVININGDVFDKRGVANVLTSGQKMARHRRIAGA
jgi:hypothetical protein